MKQKLLLISGKKSFTAALQQSLSSDYFIKVVSPNIKKNLFLQEVKKTLFHKIIFIDTGEEEIRGLLDFLLFQMPWFCNRILLVTNFRQGDKQDFKDKGIMVAYYGDIISSTFDIDSPCNNLLLTAKENKKVIMESAEKRLYPVFFDDVIKAVRTMISHTFDLKLFVFPEYEVTPLTIAKALQRIDPGIAVDIHNPSGESSEEDFFLPKHGKYMVNSVNFEARLKDVYAKMPKKANQSLSASVSDEKKADSSFLSLFSGISLAMFTILIFFPILAFFSLLSSFWALEHEKPTIAKGFALFARDAFFVSEQTTGSIFKTAYFSLGKNISEGVVLFSDAFSLFSQITKGNSCGYKTTDRDRTWHSEYF